MRIEYGITEDDYVFAARLAVATRTRRAKYTLYILPIFGALLILLGGFLALRQGSLAGVWPVLLWGTLLLLTPVLNQYQYRRQYRKMPTFQGKRLLEMDELAVHIITPTSDSRTTWPVYSKFAENDHVFILFQQGERMFIPFPKRELSSLQIDELRSFFLNHLETK